MKTFFITSKVRLLSPGITQEGLIQYSWLRHKRRWARNNRLRKKFDKDPQRYLPTWAWVEWKLQPVYERGAKQIMEEEDRRILEMMKNV